MSALEALTTELDRWSDVGRTASFWWRDDDAVAATPALDQLLAVVSGTETPVALAVIPETAEGELADRIRNDRLVCVLQHGYAHRNHAPPGEKKMELGPHRRTDHVIAELALGRERLERLFESQLVPVLVPPWNRISPQLVPMLPELQYRGLSTFAPRPRAEPVRGFHQVNTHVDLVDWRGSRDFVGPDTATTAVVAHLSARRVATADPNEPTGILTHHLVQTEESWAFLTALFETVAHHPAAVAVDARAAFPSPS